MQLDQFLKFQGLVGTGGEAKLLIQGGKVRVNGQIESRRGRKLQAGDRCRPDEHGEWHLAIAEGAQL
ncbi:MAG: RNA-binding S4 domain-containing protein [Synechococcaceae bacterium WB6_1A_059]|nr:RNA-binding S4 domain-containing protein [Synechococcaceae bacterium WB6_1A_059]